MEYLSNILLLLTSWPGIPGHSGAQSRKIFRVVLQRIVIYAPFLGKHFKFMQEIWDCLCHRNVLAALLAFSPLTGIRPPLPTPTPQPPFSLPTHSNFLLVNYLSTIVFQPHNLLGLTPRLASFFTEEPDWLKPILMFCLSCLPQSLVQEWMHDAMEANERDWIWTSEQKPAGALLPFLLLLYRWVWGTFQRLKMKSGTLPRLGEDVTELPLEVPVGTGLICKLFPFCEPINSSYCCCWFGLGFPLLLLKAAEGPRRPCMSSEKCLSSPESPKILMVL